MTELSSDTVALMFVQVGVGGLQDIIAVKEAGLPGVIVGKAFYNKSIDPKDALSAII